MIGITRLARAERFELQIVAHEVSLFVTHGDEAQDAREGPDARRLGTDSSRPPSRASPGRDEHGPARRVGRLEVDPERARVAGEELAQERAVPHQLALVFARPDAPVGELLAKVALRELQTLDVGLSSTPWRMRSSRPSSRVRNVKASRAAGGARGGSSSAGGGIALQARPGDSASRCARRRPSRERRAAEAGVADGRAAPCRSCGSRARPWRAARARDDATASGPLAPGVGRSEGGIVADARRRARRPRDVQRRAAPGAQDRAGPGDRWSSLRGRRG